MKTVYVALSGGVDSSVAAYLLQRAGHRVVGVFMRPWQPAGTPCLWESDRADALRVCSHLTIPLLTWDFSRTYGAKVARPMIRGYREGMTPNPDVECNRHIKFGLFCQRAFREGADMIATGHYARLRRMTNDTWHMANARDTNKDQTYFLWAIPPAILTRVLFPIGGMQKSQVRAIARKAGLTTAEKKDSQGVCFVGDMNVKEFLSRRIRQRVGRIVHTDGRLLGTHDGAAYYTIGQRHGLDIRDGGGPYFVIQKDMRRNIVIVGPERALYSRLAHITNVNWFCPKPPMGERVLVKVRYRTPAVPAILGRAGRITFGQAVRAIAPGQSAVVYQNGVLLGGGIIT